MYTMMALLVMMMMMMMSDAAGRVYRRRHVPSSSSSAAQRRASNCSTTHQYQQQRRRHHRDARRRQWWDDPKTTKFQRPVPSLVPTIQHCTTTRRPRSTERRAAVGQWRHRAERRAVSGARAPAAAAGPRLIVSSVRGRLPAETRRRVPASISARLTSFAGSLVRIASSLARLSLWHACTRGKTTPIITLCMAPQSTFVVRVSCSMCLSICTALSALFF